MASTNPSKSFQNVLDVKCVFQHYEKLQVRDASDFDGASKNSEVLYEKGLAKSTPSQLSKFRDIDVLVGDSIAKIQTALSKLKGAGGATKNLA